MLAIVEVCVGRPKKIGTWNGKPIYSAMKKEEVAGRTVLVTHEGLEGDEQADTRVKPNGHRIHGGPEQAICVYPWEHLEYWETELDLDLGPAAFGQNLTVVGRLETDVRIGDVYQCGSVKLRVTKYRRPCRKLTVCLGPGVAERMSATGRTGWYFAVEEPGRLATRGVLELVATNPEMPTVADAFFSKWEQDPTIPDPD